MHKLQVLLLRFPVKFGMAIVFSLLKTPFTRCRYEMNTGMKEYGENHLNNFDTKLISTPVGSI